MKTFTNMAAALLLTASLSACGQKAPTDDKSSSVATSEPAMSTMSTSSNSPETKLAKGTGVVTELDIAAGTITLDHQAIPAVAWPAMTMTFSADPGVLQGVKVGDKVAFDASITGSAGKVTAIAKR
ncbi:copper-binding protein [Parablastomonas sp. CN1-191]|uniref:copper-binding protein n=1 Tax=Parablastomonas sp. CN1-191 TaxID=3400908 RepID=UPI003BF7F297